ncbi:hypothetical protein WA026_022788 [Henosepilachna vigintioctopunctata]|uniref:PHD-type domain-containing protein n=1 Tax=Henosepilachna vigintioctopunctata TaxID=420089 RepID=A0AAW1VIT8_9CUCU
MANSIIKCGNCLGKITENSYIIECTKCELWFHLKCTNLQRVEFNDIVKKIKKNGQNSWVCNVCTESEVRDMTFHVGNEENSGNKTIESLFRHEFNSFKREIQKVLSEMIVEYNELQQKFNQQKEINNEFNLRISTLEQQNVENIKNLQNNLSKNLIINGIPKQEQNVEDITKKLIKVINADIKIGEFEAERINKSPIRKFETIRIKCINNDVKVRFFRCKEKI